MERFNCYMIAPTLSEPNCKQLAFVIIAETLPVLIIIILSKRRLTVMIIFFTLTVAYLLTRPTNFIEAPMRIVRVRDLADKAEQAILLVKYDDRLLVHVV